MTTTAETADRGTQQPNARRTRRRWPLALGAAMLAGIGSASFAAAAHADPAVQVQRQLELRNPTVLREAHVRVQIAEWAEDNHLTGLSPASLRPISPAYTPSRFGPR
jgi:hypothetical protein